MITILILIVTFLLLILAIIWGHFFNVNSHAKQNIDNNSEQLREQTNVQLYQEHKSEIEKDFNQASIDEESYQYLLTELDKSFLQDMKVNKKEAIKNATNERKLSPIWPAIITLFILAFSISLYQEQGSYLKLTQNTPQVSSQQNNTNNTAIDKDQQAKEQVAQIKKSLKETPDNSNLWYSLGQASISIGDFDGAVKAFDQVLRIEGNKPDLLGAKAQAIYYGNNQKIDSNVQQLIDQALALDPLDPSTNILLGMDNFIHQHYEKAIHYWQIIVNSKREDVNIEALTGAINEARSRLAASLNKVPNNAIDKNATSPKLTLNISLSPQFQQAIEQGDDKTIFVYAIPADGRRMPLAAMRIKASDLPITIELTNAQAMSPQFNLASAKTVHILAIISQQGTAGVKSGDYKAELKNIAVSTTKALNLEINQLVP